MTEGGGQKEVEKDPGRSGQAPGNRAQVDTAIKGEHTAGVIELAGSE